MKGGAARGPALSDMRILFRCDPALVDHLPRPVPGRVALPEWLRTMPRSAQSEAHGAMVRTVKHCPPFVDAMTHGFVIPLPCDVTVASGTLSWDWDIPTLAIQRHPRSPISFHVDAQVEGTPMHTRGQVIVKFNSFWTIELEPGWSLFAMHPANRDDLPFRLLNGLVDADRFHDVGILFPAVWLDPGFEGVLRRGTPVAQCFPVQRVAPTLAYGVLDPEACVRYDRTAAALLSGPGVYRREYRAPRLRPDGEDFAQAGDIEP